MKYMLGKNPPARLLTTVALGDHLDFSSTAWPAVVE